jgi:hypothetical protein
VERRKAEARLSIAGTLRTMSVADVVQWLSTAHKTGTLIVEGPGSSKRLYFRHGHVVAVASDDPREMLGYYLVGWGYLNEEELQYFLAMQEHFRIMLGELLVRLGHLSRKELDRVLKVKTEETLYDLVLWEEGSFRFLDFELPDREFVEVDLAVESFLLEGFRQRDERRRMADAIPDLESVPRALAPLEPVTEAERALVAALDGKRSIARLALACRLTEFEVLCWVHDGLLARTMALAPPASTVDGDGVPGAGRWHELRRGFQASLERGRLLDALRLVDALEEEPGDRTEAAAVAAELRARLEAELDRGPLGRPGVLEPALEPDKLIRIDCEPAEGFVLSRVTGLYTIEEVLSQLPGSRLENRVLLQDLLRRGLVKLRDSIAIRRYRQWSPIPADLDDGSLELPSE